MSDQTLYKGVPSLRRKFREYPEFQPIEGEEIVTHRGKTGFFSYRRGFEFLDCNTWEDYWTWWMEQEPEEDDCQMRML